LRGREPLILTRMISSGRSDRSVDVNVLSDGATDRMNVNYGIAPSLDAMNHPNMKYESLVRAANTLIDEISSAR